MVNINNKKNRTYKLINRNIISNYNLFSRNALLPKLRRNNTNRSSFKIITVGVPPTFQTELETYTHYLPREDELEDKRMYVMGGIRFGGRYPDIIIDKHDFPRAKQILETSVFGRNMSQSCGNFVKDILSIVKYVRKSFHTDNAVKFEIGDDGIPKVDTAWTETIDKATACFLEEIYQCKGWNDCKRSKTSLPNSFTNITALPYFVGDCREHAWLSGFLAHAYIQYCCDRDSCVYGDVRILYTKAYLIDDSKKFIRFLEDHVFVIYRDKEGRVFIIDPLYAEDIDPEGNYIKYNSNVANPIRLCDVSQYEGFSSLLQATCLYPNRGSSSPALHCGNVFVDNKPRARIANVPIHYDGTSKYLENDTRLQSIDDVLALNKVLKLSDLHYWQNHNSWCSSRG